MSYQRITVSEQKKEMPRLETIISYLRGDAVEIDLDIGDAVHVLKQLHNSKKLWRDKYRNLKIRLEDYIFQMNLKGCNSISTALTKIIEESTGEKVNLGSVDW